MVLRISCFDPEILPKMKKFEEEREKIYIFSEKDYESYY